MGCTPSKPVDVQLLDALPKKPKHNQKEQANAAPPSKPPPLISASSKLPLAEAELKQQLAVARREALDAVAQAEKYKADADAARREAKMAKIDYENVKRQAAQRQSMRDSMSLGMIEDETGAEEDDSMTAEKALALGFHQYHAVVASEFGVPASELNDVPVPFVHPLDSDPCVIRVLQWNVLADGLSDDVS